MNISCFAACFEQKSKHLNVWASAFKHPGKPFVQTGHSFRRNRRNIANRKTTYIL